MLLEKLQENENLKSELTELQSRLDATANAAVTASSEELSQPQHQRSSEHTPPQDVSNGRPQSFISVTSTADEYIDGMSITSLPDWLGLRQVCFGWV